MPRKTERFLAKRDDLKYRIQELVQNSILAQKATNIDEKFLKYLREDVLHSGDILRMVGVERQFLQQEKEHHITSPAQASSLEHALTCIAAIERGITKLATPEQYKKEVAENYTLPKNISGGLPKDEARQAIESLRTRLSNFDRSHLDETEKSFLDVRKKITNEIRKLYIAQQQQTLNLCQKSEAESHQSSPSTVTNEHLEALANLSIEPSGKTQQQINEHRHGDKTPSTATDVALDFRDIAPSAAHQDFIAMVAQRVLEYIGSEQMSRVAAAKIVERKAPHLIEMDRLLQEETERFLAVDAAPAPPQEAHHEEQPEDGYSHTPE